MNILSLKLKRMHKKWNLLKIYQLSIVKPIISWALIGIPKKNILSFYLKSKTQMYAMGEKIIHKLFSWLKIMSTLGSSKGYLGY